MYNSSAVSFDSSGAKTCSGCSGLSEIISGVSSGVLFMSETGAGVSFETGVETGGTLTFSVSGTLSGTLILSSFGTLTWNANFLHFAEQNFAVALIA